MTTRSRRKRGTEGETAGGRAEGRDRRPGDLAGLRRALWANAAFSGASGVAIAAGSSMLPELLGAGTTTLYVLIGVFLIAFALRLVLLARGEDIPRKEAVVIVASDWGWVVGSVLVIGMGFLTTLGAVLVGGTAVVVGGFAVWQGRNLPES
ncbi:MAG: hypothetical protein ACOC8K_09640 [Gemmatimonadota bacterium]